jgi:hypothetical protein
MNMKQSCTPDEIKSARAYFLDHGFFPAGTESYALFSRYEAGSMLQEKSAVIACTWALSSQALYTILEDWLCCVFFFAARPPYFILHRGASSVPLQHIIDQLYALSQKSGLKEFRLECIEKGSLKEYLLIGGYEKKISCLEQDNEYAYKTKDLINLAGRHNYKKRNTCKKFSETADFSVVPLNKNNFSLCHDVEKNWCGEHDCGYCRSFYGCEKEALELMAEIFDENRHFGLVAAAEGKPVGYIICQKMNESLAFLYFGKGNMQQLYAYLIYKTFAEYIHAEYMNISDDLGMKGLRIFKNELSRHELWPRYSCTYSKSFAAHGCFAGDSND